MYLFLKPLRANK